MNIAPEIVEVEQLRMQLHAALTGWTLTGLEDLGVEESVLARLMGGTGKEAPADHPLAEMAGSVIGGVGRHGRDLAIVGSTLDSSWLLRVNFGPTGWFVADDDYARGMAPEAPHPMMDYGMIPVARFEFKRENPSGSSGLLQGWNFFDADERSRWRIQSGVGVPPEWENRGPDWIMAEGSAIGALLRCGSDQPVLDVMTDDSLASGLGPYLACEIAHRAGVNPGRPWNSLSPDRRAAVVSQVIGYLVPAVACANRRHIRVYGRVGSPCRGCGNAVESAPVGARVAHFCPRCQPADNDHGTVIPTLLQELGFAVSPRGSSELGSAAGVDGDDVRAIALDVSHCVPGTPGS